MTESFSNISQHAMLEIDTHNALDYLRERFPERVTPQATVEFLAGGVSNIVLRVCQTGAPDFVLKQSRAQLRTVQAWFCGVERIYREIGILRLLGSILPHGTVPQVLFENRENYLFGMEAVPADHRVWKSVLLEGEVDPALGETLGTLLGTVHRETAQRPDLRAEWGDLLVFDQLRVDPFYRRLAEVVPDLQPQWQALIDSSLTHSECLVLADFSPKNILLHTQGITLVDFETGHYGDPAFDLGFFISHLLLKALRRSDQLELYGALLDLFWQAYWKMIEQPGRSLVSAPQALFDRTVPHLAGCFWARIDGKSPVNYLPDEDQHQRVRKIARDWLTNPPVNWSNLWERFQRGCHEATGS